MSAAWISKEEYDSLSDDPADNSEDASGASVLHVISGQVLESRASLYTLLQKDFQGNVIVEDVLTQVGFNEIENSNKFIQYDNVNSNLTEIAPEIKHSYAQSQTYTETYQTKTENINAQTLIRTTNSTQYQKIQNNLNLNAPTTLSLNASESIARNINTRNLSVGQYHASGQSYSACHNQLKLSSGITAFRSGGHFQLGANKLSLGGSGSESTQVVKPRRMPECLFQNPTPAPKNIIGTCDYYKWRNQDYILRHKNCSHPPAPDYYISYGYKYCQRFSTVLLPQLSPQGQQWLLKARYNLQIDLEQLLQQHPQIELNNEAFREAVFKTHPKAYLSAGFLDLPVDDWLKIGLTPDPKTWEDPTARAQVYQIGSAITEYEERKIYTIISQQLVDTEITSYLAQVLGEN